MTRAGQHQARPRRRAGSGAWRQTAVPCRLTTAADAQANQRPLAPTGTDQVLAELQSRIAAETDPVKRQALVEALSSMSPPPATTAEESNKLRQVNHMADQEAYPQQQQGNVPLGVTDPIAFKPDAQATIDQRTRELQVRDPVLRRDPAQAHRRAVQSLQQDGTLPNEAEVNQMRSAARNKLATLGFAGDPRIQSYLAPGEDKARDHMMIGLRGPGAASSPAGTSPPNGTSPPAGTAPPVAAAPPAPYAPASSIFGTGAGPQSSNTPTPPPWFWNHLTSPVTNPAPQGASQLFGGVAPQAAPAPVATAAAAPPAPAGPGQPIAKAMPGQRDNTPAYDAQGRVIGVVRGGLVYPQ